MYLVVAACHRKKENQFWMNRTGDIHIYTVYGEVKTFVTASKGPESTNGLIGTRENVLVKT